MDYFELLGTRIEREWRLQNYDEKTFGAIALDALRKRRGDSRRPTPLEVIEWVNSDYALPEQHSPGGTFGEPPVTVYNGSRFIIEVLFWMDGTTSIHEHGFSGAFEVLAGSSIHSTFRFVDREDISGTFCLGRLELLQMELLEIGSVRAIKAGGSFIHSLFHLDRPSVTIVVRTKAELGVGSQFSYLPPGVGYAGFVEDDRARLRVASLAALRALAPDKFWPAWRAAAEFLDLQAFHMTLSRFAADDDPRELEAVLRVARRRHGDHVDMLLAACDDARRQSWIVARRADIHHPEHRFFLALALNAPDRASLLGLVRERYPKQQPIALVMRWIRELTAQIDPALGFSLGDTELRILELMLSGKTFEEIVTALRREFDGVGELRAQLRTLYDTLRIHPLFMKLCTPDQPRRVRTARAS